MEIKTTNKITVEEVQEVIRALGGALGLVGEYQESSLETFVRKFRSMDLAKAYSIVQSIILNSDYIEVSADEQLIELAPLFPYRAKEDIKEKIMRVESIRVAVALLIIAKNNPDMVYKDWSNMFPFIEIFKEVSPYELDIRLEAIIDYMERD